MPTIGQRIRMFLASPQGKRAIAEGQRKLSDPRNQQKLRTMLSRLQRRR